MVTCDACVLSHDYQKSYQAGLAARLDPSTVAMMRAAKSGEWDRVRTAIIDKGIHLWVDDIIDWIDAGCPDLPKEE
jgi:hypothetical protein